MVYLKNCEKNLMLGVSLLYKSREQKCPLSKNTKKPFTYIYTSIFLHAMRACQPNVFVNIN